MVKDGRRQTVIWTDEELYNLFDFVESFHVSSLLQD